MSDMADKAAAIADAAGLSLQDWQVDILRDLSAVDSRGKWAHGNVGLSIPRQAGKSHVSIAWAVTLVMMGYKVLWTDHNYSTACEMLERFRDVFGRRPSDKAALHPSFNKHLVDSSSKTAQEWMRFDTGGLLRVSTRTKSANLGMGFDVVFYDEAQELTVEHTQIIAPTTSSGAKHNTQFVFAGTPTRAGSQATVFQDMRRRFADGGQPPRECWWEWSVPDRFDMSDEALLVAKLEAVNPSLGRTADIDSIRAGIGQMDEGAALQEYFGWWLPHGAIDSVIQRSEWDACKVGETPHGTECFGVRFTPDGRTVAVSVCVSGDRRFVELVHVEPTTGGVRWLADKMAAKADRIALVAIDGKSGADVFAQMLVERLPRAAVHVVTTGEAIAAASGIVDAVRGGTLAHRGQPQLADSATMTAKRPIGSNGGFGFADTEAAEAAPIESAALALWASSHTKRNPSRKQRML